MKRSSAIKALQNGRIWLLIVNVIIALSLAGVAAVLALLAVIPIANVIKSKQPTSNIDYTSVLFAFFLEIAPITLLFIILRDSEQADIALRTLLEAKKQTYIAQNGPKAPLPSDDELLELETQRNSVIARIAQSLKSLIIWPWWKP